MVVEMAVADGVPVMDGVGVGDRGLRRSGARGRVLAKRSGSGGGRGGAHALPFPRSTPVRSVHFQVYYLNLATPSHLIPQIHRCTSSHCHSKTIHR